MVLLEAAALGRPIVCTNVGEASRVLQHGVEALIVEPRDVRAMANGLERLIRDHSLRRTLRRRGAPEGDSLLYGGIDGDALRDTLPQTVLRHWDSACARVAEGLTR